MERPDFILSYWILGWFILYQLKYIPYSPKQIFILGLLENLFILLIMIYHSYVYTIYFVIVILLLKVLPLWIMRNDPFRLTDTYFTGFIVFLYLIWLKLHHYDPAYSMRSHLKSIQENKEWGPSTHFLLKLTHLHASQH
jgi:hypothetical protein